MTKILGLGNALVDVMTQLNDDSFLAQHELPKGSMQLVDLQTSGNILKNAANLPQSLSSGGSAANTIHGIACMGAATGYIGSVGNDSYGEFFRKDMAAKNIEPKLFVSNTETGRAIALISPDSERTFATFLGAAVEMTPEALTDNLFAGYDILHTEGYLVFNNSLILEALVKAKKNGLKVSLDMASFNVVEANLDFLKTLIKDYVDIVFANEEEAKALTGMEPEQALDEISKFCEIAVVKIGAKGSLIKSGDYKVAVSAINAVCKDTTGAGDLFASGFLYGLSNNWDLKKCGNTGSILAGNVIEVIGAKMPEERWERIYKMVNELK
ncbi:MAG: adenosine kinase [Bacteroidales bacterium]|nr:adenosine kinase [Bacteroidales bacterium]